MVSYEVRVYGVYLVMLLVYVRCLCFEVVFFYGDYVVYCEVS